jgi:hypothetical protein
MHTSTSGSISASEQGKDCTRFDPLLTATDRNSVFFRCSCVFFVSRETSRSIQEFERRDSRIALNRATDTALARLGSPMYARSSVWAAWRRLSTPDAGSTGV